MRDEVVVITGGSSGIGLATARLFADKGARVRLVARDPEKLERAASRIPGATWYSADVADPASLESLADRLRSADGKVDTLINSAGQLELARAEDSVSIAARLMETNYLGLVRTISTLLPLLRSGDRRSIVNLSSFVGRISPPYFSAYSATKHAVQAYTHALRQELRPEGFRVSLVLPGPVASPMTEDRLRTPMYPIPWGVPVITPDRVARAILETTFTGKVEQIVPRRFGLLMRLGSAFPTAVDKIYGRKLL